jgi:hypothetical protein
MTDREEAVRIDTELAGLYEELQRQLSYRHGSRDHLHIDVGDRHVWHNRRSAWGLSYDETVTRARQMIESGNDPRGAIRDTLDRIARYQEKIDELEAQMASLEAVYAASPWPRYFPCQNTHGHIHRSLRGCSTVRWDTLMGWYPHLSGMPFDEAKDLADPVFCTVCFPGAPVEYTRDPAEYHRERNAGAKAAEKAARQAVKDAKNLAPGEVIVLKDGSHERITTVAAAKDALRREVEFRDYYGRGEHPSHAAWAQAAEVARSVLLAREATHEGWGATQAQIDKIIASAVIKNRKEGARI